MTPFNLMAFRRHFPALNQQRHYLDNAATTLKPQSMIDAIQRYYSDDVATVHRSQHHAAQYLTQQFESTRQQVAELIHAPHSEQIIWTRGATEAINLVAQSYLRPRLQAGDEIIVSEAEHHANLLPWLIVAEQCHARVIPLRLDKEAVPDISQLPQLLNQRTRLLALSQMSNVTGAIPDLAQAIHLAHANGTVVMVDGAQGAAHYPLDVTTCNADFYTFSAHKLYGPTGLGVLYSKPEYLATMPAWQGGGKMLTHVDFNGFTPQPAPHRFEAGTPHIAGVIGFAATLDWWSQWDHPAAEQHTVALTTSAEKQLGMISGFRHYRAPNSPILSFNIEGLHHQDLITLIAEQGVSIRAGQHCAQPLMQALGIKGTLRASFAPYNTPQDVTALVNAVNYAVSLLREEPL